MASAAAARDRIARLNKALRGDPEALAELDRKYETGIDPIDLAHSPDEDQVQADRSAAAKKAWETRRRENPEKWGPK